MKAILLVLLFSTCAIAQVDPCTEIAGKTIKIVVNPDETRSLKPITDALKQFKPGFNLIVDVQSGSYIGDRGVLIDKNDVCLRGQGKPTIQRTKFSNEKDEPSVIKVTGASNVVVSGFEITGVINPDNCPVGPVGVSVLNFTGKKISNIRIANNAVHTIGQDYDTHCFDSKKKEIIKQAHGIKVVSNQYLVETLAIESNQLSNLRLGESEAITVAGNIVDFVVSGNEISDVDNIAIDIIGQSEDTPFQATRGKVTDNRISDLKPGNRSYPFVAGIYIDGGTGLSWAEPILIEKNTVSNFGIGISVGSENNYCDKAKAKAKAIAKGKAIRCPVLTRFVHITNNNVRDNQLYGIGVGKDVFNSEDRQNSQSWDVRIVSNTIIGNVRYASEKGYGQIHFGSLEIESLKRIELRGNLIASSDGGLLVTLSGSEEKKYLLPDVSFDDNEFASEASGSVWTWGKTAEQLERYSKTRLTGATANQLLLPPGIKGANNRWKTN